MSAVEPLGIDAVELAHAAREIGLGRLDDQMVVVGHLAPDVTAPTEPLAHDGEDVEESAPVVVVEEDVVTRVAPRGEMIERAGKFDPQGPSHRGTL